MKNSQYLYGGVFDATSMAIMPYTEALKYKINCAKTLTSKLVASSVLDTDWRRINSIAKAISFNEALLSEAEGKD
jgi:hypothetical protein